MAVGHPGELYIGGLGVARSYVNAGALTASLFAGRIHEDLTGSRMYRTGDRVRRLTDGRSSSLVARTTS